MSVAAWSTPPPWPRPLWVEATEDVRELARHADAWEDLAADAVEANVFYEPWMLLPVLDAFAADRRLIFVLVWGPGVADRPPCLHGLFPLERRLAGAGCRSQPPACGGTNIATSRLRLSGGGEPRSA